MSGPASVWRSDVDATAAVGAGARQDWFGRGVLRQGWRPAAFSIVLAAAVYLFNDVYYALNHGPARMVLQTPLDRAIPVVPIFVVPYVSLDYYVYLSLAVFLLLRQRVFQSAAIAMLLAWAISYAVYFFAQTYVARPSLAGGGVFVQMIRDVYASDAPYNAFPSLHVSISTLMAIHWWRLDRRAGLVAAIWTALIVPSTLFVHQHYIADVLAGLAVAAFAAWAAPRLLELMAGGPWPLQAPPIRASAARE